MLFQSVFTRRLSRVFEWLISLALLMSATVAGSGAEWPLRSLYAAATRYERRYGSQAGPSLLCRRQTTVGRMNVPSKATLTKYKWFNYNKIWGFCVKYLQHQFSHLVSGFDWFYHFSNIVILTVNELKNWTKLIKHNFPVLQKSLSGYYWLIFLLYV